MSVTFGRILCACVLRMREMSKWMNEMKIDEISPFPISRLSLRFSIPRERLYLILLLILLLLFIIILFIFISNLFVLNGYQNNLNGNQGN